MPKYLILLKIIWMFDNKKIYAIIPARKGSKRLPNKNQLALSGKPLIAWTIEAAKESKFIDEIIISTDDEHIMKIAEQYGIPTPFKRPKTLSEDGSKTIDVLLHAINYFNIKETNKTVTLLLQPTSPLRNHSDIDNSIEMLDKKTKAIVSVCETEHPPLWSNTLPTNLSMRSFLSKEILNKRSQDLPTYYRLNGAVYVAETDYLVKNYGFFGPQTKAYIMPIKRSVDIDTELDFLFTEVILKYNMLGIKF